MFSFVNDTVLDPFCGTGTTMISAMQFGRNSIGIELDEKYSQMAAKRLYESINLLDATEIKILRSKINDKGKNILEKDFGLAKLIE